MRRFPPRLLFVGFLWIESHLLAAEAVGLFRGDPATLFPATTFLGTDWEADEGPKRGSLEHDYLYVGDGGNCRVMVQLSVSNSVGEAFNRWFAGRRIPSTLAWKMEAEPGIGERAQFGTVDQLGSEVAYLHFFRGNVYAKLLTFAHPRQRTILQQVARGIDDRLKATIGTDSKVIRDIISDAQVAKITASLRPLVEELAGRKFRQPPEVLVVGTDAFIGAIAADLRLQYAKQEPANRKLEFAADLDRHARNVGTFAVGRYSYSQRQVLIPAEAVGPALQRAKVAAENIESALTLIIGHELVHALQDQSVDLASKLAACANSDARQALSATIEGHALLVQDRLAARLVLPEAVRNFSNAGNDGFDSSVEEGSLKDFQAAFRFVYVEGKAFIERKAQTGGDAAIWEALTTPPTTAAEIREKAR